MKRVFFSKNVHSYRPSLFKTFVLSFLSDRLRQVLLYMYITLHKVHLESGHIQVLAKHSPAPFTAKYILKSSHVCIEAP